MKKYNRIFTMVIDSLGVGAMEDEKYGDKGADTLDICVNLWKALRYQTFKVRYRNLRS